MATNARGTFHVKLNPLQPYNTTEDAKLARMSIDKEFHGDLQAASRVRCSPPVWISRIQLAMLRLSASRSVTWPPR